MCSYTYIWWLDVVIIVYVYLELHLYLRSLPDNITKV